MRHKTPLVMRKRKRLYRNILEKSSDNHQNRVRYEYLAVLFLQAKDGDFTWNCPVATPDTMVTSTTTQKLGIPLCSLDSMSSLPMQLQVAI
ncbi:uncharacterized protein LOC102036107 [Geospiza fortis]|uniref:Uncharacterized protein LOC102036107 n=1 Tax=Geospiza fortis TaxID=48883 RepID=A0A8N5HVW1_GEOFO|nr:uncharacterized protein LOC102036107 [Geospiza fortis]